MQLISLGGRWVGKRVKIKKGLLKVKALSLSKTLIPVKLHGIAFQKTVILSPGYTRDWLPAYSFVLRASAMVLMGQRTLSDTSGARQ